jgi:uncharacterized protein YndB with AHSA1/START domain
MSEHEVTRTVQAPAETVFALAADVRRLPEWLATVSSAQPLQDETSGPPTTAVRVEGESSGGHYADEGFWRPSAEQRRVEWGSPSRGGDAGGYAGSLQVHESGAGGSEVTVHLSFLDGDGPGDVEAALAASLDALADLAEG